MNNPKTVLLITRVTKFRKKEQKVSENPEKVRTADITCVLAHKIPKSRRSNPVGVFRTTLLPFLLRGPQYMFLKVSSLSEKLIKKRYRPLFLRHNLNSYTNLTITFIRFGVIYWTQSIHLCQTDQRFEKHCRSNSNMTYPVYTQIPSRLYRNTPFTSHRIIFPFLTLGPYIISLVRTNFVVWLSSFLI